MRDGEGFREEEGRGKNKGEIGSRIDLLEARVPTSIYDYTFFFTAKPQVLTDNRSLLRKYMVVSTFLHEFLSFLCASS